ncbi:MAG: sigma-70 family RNA polymerase sigma factor [Chloroflexota bacterium]
MEAQPLAIPPDAALLRGLAGGDEAAFETLFLRYYAQVYGVLFRLVGDRQEAEDLAQEVFLKLHGQRFGRAEEQNLGGWLYRVAVNAALNARRAGQRRERREESATRQARVLSVGEAPDPAQVALRNEERVLVRRALAGLAERDRLCLVLRYAGLSYAEVAKAIEVAPGSVGTLLARAEERFRERFRALGEEEEQR